VIGSLSASVFPNFVKYIQNIAPLEFKQISNVFLFYKSLGISYPLIILAMYLDLKFLPN
jgi:hypothetical protein